MYWIDPFGLEQINLFSSKDRIYDRAKYVPDKPGTLTIMAHGNESNIKDDRQGIENRKVLNAKDLADLIKASGEWKQGMPIEVQACHAGDGKNSLAQQLSNELDTIVTAPDGYAIYVPRGRIDYGILPFLPFTADMITFNPNKKK